MEVIIFMRLPLCVKAASGMQVEDEEQLKTDTFSDIISLSVFHKHPAFFYQNQTEIFPLPVARLFRSNRESQVHSALLCGLVK